MPRQNQRRGWKEEYQAFRLAAKAKEASGVGEIFRGDSFERCAKLGKRGKSCLRVLRVCLDEKVDVLRKARLRVVDNSEAAYNEVFNAMKAERVRHMPNVSSLHTARDLSPDQRRAIESLLGRILDEDELVSVRTWKESLAGDAREEAFRKRAEGVSEEQIDAAIDEAVDYVRHNRR
jgi:hypothetical protein